MLSFFSLAIASPENLVAVVVMVVVALLVALVVARADTRAAQAAVARTEAALLASFARAVLSRADPLPRLLARVREAFGLRRVALVERSGEVAEAAGEEVGGRPDVDVGVDEDLHLAGWGRSLTATERRLFDTVGGQALLALRERRASAEAAEARRRADASGLRTALLSALGHDLRSPTAVIKAAAGSLRDPALPLSDADRGELLDSLAASTDRLTALVDNLLDSSRLATGAVVPALRAVGVDEIVDAVLAGAEREVAAAVDAAGVAVDPALPDVLVDPGLAERVVANLLDNAVRHGGGSVALRASAHDDRVELRVIDRGPGLPRRRREQLFTPFQRLGDRDATTGLGLGLHVARGFALAMDGALDAEDTPGGGLTLVFSLATAGAPAVLG